MRIALLASVASAMALMLAACGEKAATDGASTEAATPAPAEAAATPPPAPAGAKAADAAAFAKYVPWNKAHPDVKKTGSGLEYVVLASGPAEGKPPTNDQEVEVFYEGRLNATGAKFDSAFDRGESASFPVAGVVPGFSEALKLMRPGDRWLVYFPAALGYGARSPSPDLPANSDLVFEIEMVKVH